MDYFFSHIGIIFFAAVFVAVAAIAWWYLTEKNAELIRQRAEARRKAKEQPEKEGLKLLSEDKIDQTK